MSPQKDSRPSVELILYQSLPPRYSAAALAELADVHPEMVLCYWRLGLLQAEEQKPQDPLFDDDELFLLKRLEQLRKEYSLSLRALRLLAQALHLREG
jgi:DNA-binding transcriptional MerR regulator